VPKCRQQSAEPTTRGLLAAHQELISIGPRDARSAAPPRANTTKLAMKIGFIGLGLMGRRIVAILQKAGFDLIVHDLLHDSQHSVCRKGRTLG
jgi:phosphoglycerate dehydrogenase-like enzyme